MSGWREHILPVAALLALCAILLGFELGKTGLIDPDEPFYSLTAKEMLARHDASTPVLFGQPQFEKPILFYWVVYGFFRWLGVSELSARLGPALAGSATVVVAYFWALALWRRRAAAFVSAAVLAASLEFVVLSRIVLTDIFLCLFTTASLFCFSLGERHASRRALYWNLVFVFSALGFLTKGPLGFFIPFSGIVSYAALTGGRAFVSRIPWKSGLFLFALIGLPWYALMTWKYGPAFLEQTFLHENLRRFFVAEHRGMNRWSFYPLVLFAGFFPWSVFTVPALAYAARRRADRTHLFLGLCFALPFVFFCLAASKLISYIFPVFPVVALLTGGWMFRAWRAMRLGAVMRPGFAAASVLAWGMAPAVLVAGAFVFARMNGVDAAQPLSAIAFTMVPLLWAALYAFFRKRPVAAFGLTVLAMAFLSPLSFGWLLPEMEGAISSKPWAGRHEASLRADPDGEILTSKMFVRGVSFYTGHTALGVLSGKPDGGFYTPHPIPIVSDAEGLSRVSGGSPLHLLLREKEWKLLNRLNGGRYALSTLETSPPRRWVRLDHV